MAAIYSVFPGHNRSRSSERVKRFPLNADILEKRGNPRLLGLVAMVSDEFDTHTRL